MGIKFKNLNKNFEKLKEQIIFKFDDQINKYIKKKIY